MPSFSSQYDGRVAGQMMAVQLLVARLLAEHPEGEKILGLLGDMAPGLRAQAAGVDAAGPAEFLRQMAAGVEEAQTTIGEFLEQRRKGRTAHS